MQSPHRMLHWAFILSITIGFLQPFATPSASPVPDGMQVYIGHSGRMTALIPADWRVPVNRDADYAGDDGFVLSSAIPAGDADDA